MPGQILVIDPIAINRIVLRSRVAASCHIVAQASGPDDAQDMLAQHQTDLIILGPGIGHVQACDMTRQLRAGRYSKGIPVVVLTQDMSPGVVQAALRAGAEDALEPRMQNAFLLARIRKLLRQHGTHEDLDARPLDERQPGVAEAGVGFTHPGNIALVTRNISKGRAWQVALEPLLSHRIDYITQQSALTLCPPAKTPDMFIVQDNADQADDTLRFLAEMRSRQCCRNAAVLLVGDPATMRTPGAENRMAMALDIGATDVLRNGFDAEELALRADVHIARKREEDRLRNQVKDGLRDAVRDPLTGIHNRRYALPHLEQVAALSATKRRGFALMMVDVDRFKSVNDTYGHATGDKVLIEIATRLRDNIRKQDLLARIGGEEFLIVMPDTDLELAQRTATRLCHMISSRPILAGPKTPPLPITVSIGIAMSGVAGQPVGETVQSLLDRADQALYAAKAQGRNKVTVFQSAA